MDTSTGPSGGNALLNLTSYELNGPGVLELRKKLGTGDTKDYTSYRDTFKTRYLRVILDLLTMWDRITGGTTMMFHIDGSRAPGKPLIADDVRVQSYLTPAIINEVPDASIIAAHLAQLFTEGIAVPTMARWERAARQKGWFSNQQDIPVTHVTANAIPKPLLPTPEGVYYLFVGHPPDKIERLIAEIKGINVKSSGTEELIMVHRVVGLSNYEVRPPWFPTPDFNFESGLTSATTELTRASTLAQRIPNGPVESRSRLVSHDHLSSPHGKARENPRIAPPYTVAGQQPNCTCRGKHVTGSGLGNRDRDAGISAAPYT
ncbi:hypothetical protein OBBRIDRAFT_808447 [Obba rivulosa]|uniref:Uncharacterized protein n=1 Tax=Obba rivulosa TaxID=1052685 RepID=A0A8E2AH92_9APHY|nr:hypothetical protein OBBRIDRAFT_808447 [Obba rivulosa]